MWIDTGGPCVLFSFTFLLMCQSLKYTESNFVGNLLAFSVIVCT